MRGCQECPRIYIGETGRTAKKRAEEHESRKEGKHGYVSRRASCSQYWSLRTLATTRNYDRDEHQNAEISGSLGDPLVRAR